METRTVHVPGFTIGTAEDRKGLTGVTVILAPEGGAAAAVDVRGCAPGTRETDLLSPEKQYRKSMQLSFPAVLPSGWNPIPVL